jgi:hypothetical protein
VEDGADVVVVEALVVEVVILVVVVTGATTEVVTGLVLVPSQVNGRGPGIM